MKTLAKIVGVLVIVVVLLIAAAAVLVPMFFDPNDYKDQLARAVKENTGRELKIDGDIGLSVFPWLGVDLGAVKLGNAPGFKATSFAQVEQASVRIKLMPLLSRQVEMDTVTVHGLSLNLERKADGSTNLDDLAKPGVQKPKAAKESSPDGGMALAGLAIGGLDVKNANVSWSDALGQSYAISGLDAQTGALALGRPVDFELRFDVAGGKPALEGRVEVTAKLVSDLDAQVHRVDGLRVRVDLKGEQFPKGALVASIEADVKADLNKQTATVENLKLSSGELVLSGGLQVEQITGDPSYRGQLSVARFNGKTLLASLGMEPIRTTDDKALTSASMQFKIDGNTKQAGLDPLTIKLDDTTITGDVKVASLATGALRFNLAADAIDADRYLPPGSSAPKPATPGSAAAGAGEVPVETLRALDIAGTVKLGKLKVSNLRLSEMALTVKAKDGLVRFSPIQAKLYEGTYAGDISIDAREPTPVVSVNESLPGVQAGPLLVDLQGVDKLTGTANVTAQLRARGRAVEAMKGTLNGNIRFSFLEGAIKGFNLGKMLRDAKAKLGGGSAVAGGGLDQTDFSELSGTVDVKDGVATNSDLSAKSPFLRVNGKGTAHLVDETIDYRLVTSVVATTQGQGGSDLKDLAGLDIPVKVGGTFSKPSYNLDFEALAAAFAKSKAASLVSEQKEALTKKVTEGVTEKLGADAIKKLGGDQADKIGGALKGILGN